VSLGLPPILQRLCSARLQAGIGALAQFPPEGGRYKNANKNVNKTANRAANHTADDAAI